jgi:hypothetical protein
MKLPDDLKDYRDRDSFSLFTPDEALAILFWILFIAWLSDRLNWLIP